MARFNYLSMRSVFDTVCALKDMSDFTIYKFDFSDFFNSVSSIYVYQKYIQDKGLERFNAELLNRFVYDTKYTYAGLNTSNILCEIIAKEFDELLMQKLSKSGVILYKRYIDDGIVIFNRYISKDDCLKNVNEATADESVYSLYNNMKEYRTLLFVEKIGISKETLQKMCAQVGVNNSTDKEYDGLVRDYLIKVKVGH